MSKHCNESNQSNEFSSCCCLLIAIAILVNGLMRD